MTDDTILLLSLPCQRGIFEARIPTATPVNAHVLSIFNPLLLAPFMQRNVFVIFSRQTDVQEDEILVAKSTRKTHY